MAQTTKAATETVAAPKDAAKKSPALADKKAADTKKGEKKHSDKKEKKAADKPKKPKADKKADPKHPAAAAAAATPAAPAADGKAAAAPSQAQSQPAPVPAAAAAPASAKPAPAAANASAPAPKSASKPAASKSAAAKPAPAATAHDQKAPAFHKKIAKAKGAAPTELEQSVARALFELESSTKDLTTDLTDLFIVAAKEVGVEQGKKCVVVFVPYRQHSKYKKIQGRLIRELEKKLGRSVVIIAQRTILSTNYSRQKKGQIRPRSRTLTAVHNAILDDLVFPTLIVGKRMRVKSDLSRIIKVHLDPKDVKETEHKLKTFSSVYAALTNKKVEFLFPLGED